MIFHYTASQADGKIVEGDTEAQGSTEVLLNLSSKGLKPISVEQRRSLSADGWRFFARSISVSDKVFLTRYLSLILKSGTDLWKAIDILINDIGNPILKALLIEVKYNLEKGNPFYTTFVKYPKFFSPVFVNLIRAGESSGNLIEAFDNLSASLEQEAELKSKISSALIYPIILLVLSFAMLVLMITFSIPKIAAVFLTTNIQPPLFSRIVFSTGLFLNQYIAILLPIFIGLAILIWYFAVKTYIGRKFTYDVGSHLPVVRGLLEKLALYRFTSTLASLMKSGLPIIKSLEITADAVGYEKFRTALLNIANQGIAKGLTIGEAFKKEQAFPAVINNLIAISEKSGHTEEVLRTLAFFYKVEIDISLKILVSFIEPVLLLIIGFVVGGMALAIIVPVYQLVGGI